MTARECPSCLHRNGGRHRCTPAQRFERDVVMADGCWGWRGFLDRQGYGFVTVDNRHVRAHRFAWERAHGPIPDGMCVLHRCDNPTCSNPTHLFLGTRTDNARDCDAKGRRRNGKEAQTCCSKCGGPFSIRASDGHRTCVPCQRERVAACGRRKRQQRLSL